QIMQRPRTHRRKVRQIDPQQFACDEIGRIIRQIVYALDDRVSGNHQTPPAVAIEERRVVEQTETAGPRERRIEPADPLEFVKSFRHHDGYSSSVRSVRANRSRTPLARPGSLPVKNAWAMAVYSLIVTRGGTSVRCTSS